MEKTKNNCAEDEIPIYMYFVDALLRHENSFWFHTRDSEICFWLSGLFHLLHTHFYLMLQIHICIFEFILWETYTIAMGRKSQQRRTILLYCNKVIRLPYCAGTIVSLTCCCVIKELRITYSHPLITAHKSVMTSCCCFVPAPHSLSYWVYECDVCIDILKYGIYDIDSGRVV